MSRQTTVSLTVNGQQVTHDVEPRVTLADFLRDECDLTGTHLGCEHGVCGACTVLLDGDPVRSCLMLAVQVREQQITTIEGLTDTAALHPVQQALRETHGLQCGFCTPGLVLTIVAHLREEPEPDEAAIREALAGNICRCTGYQGIVEGVRRAAAALRPEGGATR